MKGGKMGVARSTNEVDAKFFQIFIGKVKERDKFG
jgi:hypothetical protein